MASKTKATPQKEADAGEGVIGAFCQLENQKALATTIGIRKQFCQFLARVRFHTNQGQSRPNEAIVFAFRSSAEAVHI